MSSIRPHRLAALLSCAILLSLAEPSARAEAPAPPTPSTGRPRIGLVLSGGGARGASHIGVLRVLEQRRVPIDCIAGTSMGALVGGLYATGLTAEELERIVTGIDWTRAFSDRVPRRDRSFRRKSDDELVLVGSRPGIRRGALRFPPGLIDGQHVDLLLARHTLPVATVRDFDSLAVPYRAVAADVVNGDAVVLARGSLALAMRSSMAIPAVFAPREVDGRLLVDGGISENLPIAVARAMGADVLIVVDIGTPPVGREGLGSLVAITTQLITVMSERNRARALATLDDRDVFIRPDLGDITTASFGRVADAVQVGARAAETVAPRLDALALPPAEYAAWRAARPHPGAPPVIDSVRIVNRSRLGDDVLAARLAVPTGVPLDADAIERACDRVIALELFESVGYDIERVAGRNVLTVTVRERSWGPDYLQAGVAAFEDFEGPDFDLSLAFTRTALDRRAGEWRTIVSMGRDPALETELHRPLDRALRWFVQARLAARDQAINVFDAAGDKRSELEARRVGGELVAGRELGTWGEARVGILRESGDLDTRVGETLLADRALATGDVYGRLAVDRLDDLDFPRAGYRLSTRYTAGLRALGSASAYRQLASDVAIAGSRGRWSTLLTGSLATTLSGVPPLQAEYALGGFTRLSGLQYDERHGANTALASAVAYRRLNDLVVLPLFGGLSAEYGAMSARHDDLRLADGIASGSAFVGFDTLLGPVLLAYGRAEGGRSNYYLSLGETLHLRRIGFWRH